MNRAQTRVDLYFVGRSDGNAARILTETDDAWVQSTLPGSSGRGAIPLDFGEDGICARIQVCRGRNASQPGDAR